MSSTDVWRGSSGTGSSIKISCACWASLADRSYALLGVARGCYHPKPTDCKVQQQQQVGPEVFYYAQLDGAPRRVYHVARAGDIGGIATEKNFHKTVATERGSEEVLLGPLAPLVCRDCGLNVTRYIGPANCRMNCIVFFLTAALEQGFVGSLLASTIVLASSPSDTHQ